MSMTRVSESQTIDQQCWGEFQFISAQAESSLYRNGRVLIHREANGNTASSQGIELDQHRLHVINARTFEDSKRMTCETNGFELCLDPLADDKLDFRSHAQVVQHYYEPCAQLVSQVTAAQVFAFDHNVRSAQGKQARTQLEGGQEVQEPAHLVHGDYTLRSGPERLGQLGQPPSGNDTLLGMLADGQPVIATQLVESVQKSGRRFAIINVWRNIQPVPVATHPMALCDAQTVTPQDLVVFEIHYPDRIGENYFSKYSPRHQMYYYPGMTRDEALLIKQWDSAGPMARSDGALGDDNDNNAPCTFSFHSAFDAPDTPVDAPDRWSIEVRCMVVYEQ